MSQRKEVNLHEIECGLLIGEGSQALVCVGIHQGTPLFALKIYKQNKMYSDAEAKAAAKAEIEANLKLDCEDGHGNIVKFYSATVHYGPVTNGKHKQKVVATVLIYELVKGGDLLSYLTKPLPPLKKPLPPFKEPVARFIARQIINGVFYAHSKGVWVLDIKLENILVDGNLELWNWKNWIKLADFGLSHIQEEGK